MELLRQLKMNQTLVNDGMWLLLILIRVCIIIVGQLLV